MYRHISSEHIVLTEEDKEIDERAPLQVDTKDSLDKDRHKGEGKADNDDKGGFSESEMEDN